MENILIATDFSESAAHAARYGYALAQHLHAGVILCNAFIVAAEVPEAGTITWPMYEYDDLLKDSRHELAKLKQTLEDNGAASGFRPDVSTLADCGTVADVLNEAVTKHEVLLTVMATHSADGLSSLLIGDHARRAIDGINSPLLLVPGNAPVTAIKKIAFATDFRNPDEDLQAIFELIPILKKLNAELLLTHVCNAAEGGYHFKKNAENFLAELSNKANYPHIYYRLVKNSNPERGLDWLCDFGHIDILAMVHHKRSVLGQIFGASHSKKMASHTEIPLLILPEK